VRNIVVGNSVESVIFAWKNDFIMIHYDGPTTLYDYFEPDLNLAQYFFPKLILKDRQIQMIEGLKKVGPTIHNLKAMLLFDLGLQGLLPFSDRVTNITILEEENKLKVSLDDVTTETIEYDGLILFETHIVENSEANFVDGIEGEYVVIDWFIIRRLLKRNLEYYERDNKFVNNFHITSAISSNRKLLVSKSYLTLEELEKEFDSNAVLHEIDKILIDNDFQNAVRHQQKANKSDFLLEPIRRIKFKNWFFYDEDNGNIEYRNDTLEMLLENIKPKERKLPWIFPKFPKSAIAISRLWQELFHF